MALPPRWLETATPEAARRSGAAHGQPCNKTQIILRNVHEFHVVVCWLCCAELGRNFSAVAQFFFSIHQSLSAPLMERALISSHRAYAAGSRPPPEPGHEDCGSEGVPAGHTSIPQVQIWTCGVPLFKDVGPTERVSLSTRQANQLLLACTSAASSALSHKVNTHAQASNDTQQHQLNAAGGLLTLWRWFPGES